MGASNTDRARKLRESRKSTHRAIYANVPVAVFAKLEQFAATTPDGTIKAALIELVERAPVQERAPC